MYKKRLLLILATFLSFSAVFAKENVMFEAKAPNTVILGQNFNLIYSSNYSVKNLRIPQISDFDILMGPSTSFSSSTQIINGKRKSSTKYAYTYVLHPKNAGTFTIPSATGTINGDSYTTKSLTVKVLPRDKKRPANSGGSGYAGNTYNSDEDDSNGSSSQNISSEKVFIRVIPSKRTVYEEEPLTVTYKLYTRVDIAGFENYKFPEFKGFIAHEIKKDNKVQFDMENYKGLNYRTAVLKKTVLYPRETGKLTIDKGSFDIVMRTVVHNSSGSIFDDFFDSYQDVKKTVYSNSVTINVKPFPVEGKPADFCGISSDNLNITASVSSEKVNANDGVTVKLKISGNGNLKYIKDPDLKFPPDFDVYDPKVNNSLKINSAGVSGVRTIEYLVIPRYAGTFKIPSVSLIYFDIVTKKYKTLRTKEYTISVEKGNTKSNSGVVSNNYSSVNQEKIKMLGSDIRYIKSGDIDVYKVSYIYNKAWFRFAYPVLLIVFILFLIINRKIAKENADLSALRIKKANKIAVKRLKMAGKYLKENNKELFYDEVLKALWGYTSDKLNIPLSELNKETIENKLIMFNVNEDIRKEYIDIVQACEFTRYAPSESSRHMDDLYKETLDVINKMENTIKK